MRLSRLLSVLGVAIAGLRLAACATSDDSSRVIDLGHDFGDSGEPILGKVVVK